MSDIQDSGRFSRLRRGLVEFFAIFLGVSLSFVAEDWRESRGDQREVRLALEGVAQDIDIDLPQLASLIEMDSTGAAAGWWLHSNWDRPDLPSDSIGWALDALHFGGAYAPVRAQYESAKTSGLLSLVQPSALQNDIITLYEMQQPFVVRIGELRQEMAFDLWRLLRPYQAYSSAAEPLSVVPEIRLSVPWQTVQADRALRSALVEASGFRRLNQGRLQWHRESSIRLRDLIRDEAQR